MADAGKGGAALVTGEGVAFPAGRIVAVDILRDHVEIPTKDDRHFRCQQMRGPRAEALHPGKLVVEFRPRRRIAVRKIDRRHPHTVDRRLHVAGLLIPVIAGQPAMDILQRMAGSDGDPVVAFLAVIDDVPSDLAIEILRKIRVLGLGFLDQKDITGAGRQIGQDVVLAGFRRIHVPAGDAHRSDGEGRAAAAGCGGVWIADGEIGAHEVLHIIELGTVDELQ